MVPQTFETDGRGSEPYGCEDEGVVYVFPIELSDDFVNEFIHG
jgi:hypothetical protein